jgi:hypothetical protein
MLSAPDSIKELKALQAEAKKKLLKALNEKFAPTVKKNIFKSFLFFPVL